MHANYKFLCMGSITCSSKVQGEPALESTDTPKDKPLNSVNPSVSGLECLSQQGKMLNRSRPWGLYAQSEVM